MVQLSRSELVQALEQVKGSVAQKAFVPILTHVLFSGQTVLGYDSEVGVRVQLSKPVDVPFNVKATTFLDLLKALESEELELDVRADKVHVKCGAHRSHLTQITEEYPKPALTIKGESWRELPSGFKEALQRCMIGVSEDENNKLLSSMYVGGSIVLGADGKQAVRCTLDMNLPPMLLSRRAVGELMRLGNPKAVAMAGEGTAVFDYGNLLFLARLRGQPDQFPVAQMASMFDKPREVRPSPNGLMNALARLSLLSSKDVKHCTFKFTDLGLEVSTESETAWGTEMFPPVPGPWCNTMGLAAERVIPILQFAGSWSPSLHPRDPVYFSGETAGFEALLAQSLP